MGAVSSTIARSNRSWPAPTLAAWLWIAAGCAVHRVGYIDAGDGQVTVVGGTGRAEALVLLGDAAALKHMDGHLVDLHGRKGFGRIQVGRWRPIEGPHGMQVWVGSVQRLGVQIGVADRETGELVLVDSRTASSLASHVGEDVAIEGYVEGYARVAVVDWTVLE